MNTLLNKVEQKSEFVNDIPYILEKINKSFRIAKHPDNDLSSPFDSAFKIDDYEIES